MPSHPLRRSLASLAPIAVLLPLAACGGPGASPAAPGNATASASSAAPSASTPVSTGPGPRPLGTFTYAEDCGAQGVVTTLGIDGSGLVTVDMNGFQTWFEGKGHLVEREGQWDVVLDERNPDVPLPRFEKGAVVVGFTVRADGALEARNPPGNCTPKAGTFFKEGQAPARKLVHKVTRCPSGKGANALAGGCMCDGASVIQNPCKAGGGNPDVKGNTCVHLCSEP